ncbi:class I adenylate-forming enzyme family protein [Paenibacillus chitinolyticus]
MRARGDGLTVNGLESLLEQIAGHDGILAWDGGREVASYASVWSMTEKNASALSKLGFVKAEAGRPRQVLLASVSLGWRFLPVMLAALHTGVTLVPVDDSRYKGQSGAVRSRFPDALVLDEGNVGEDGGVLVQRIPAAVRRAEPALADVAFLLGTSGTTGKPKAVMLTEANIASNTRAISAYFGLGQGDRLLVARSPVHASVLIGELLAGLVSGCSFSLHPTAASPMSLLKRAQADAVTVACMTPSAANLLAPFAERAEPGTLRKLVLSGECAHEFQLKRVAEAFPQAALWNAYGLTEASPRISCLRDGWLAAGWSCAGTPLDGVDIRIVDGEGRALREGEEGELLVRGPNIMKGYYADEAATAAKLAGGWLHTADLAAVRSGRLHVYGRSDSTIIRGGMNIHPAEVEAALLACGGVREAVVFSAADSRLGQKVHAWIVTEPGVDEKAVMRALTATELERRLLPDVLERKAALERTAAGKLVRPYVGAKPQGSDGSTGAGSV